MAKTKLNAADREVLTSELVAHKFDKLQLANRKEQFDLADRAYKRVYPDKTRRAMEALGAGAFKLEDDFYVAVNGQRVNLYFGPCKYDEPYMPKVDEPERRPLFERHTGYGENLLSVLDDDPLGAAVIANAHARKDLEEERSHLTNVTKATLAQFVYFEDLIEAFPEGVKIIEKRLLERPQGGSTGVPAVQMKSLAAALDLP